MLEDLPEKGRSTAIANIVHQLATIDPLGPEVVSLDAKLLHLLENIFVRPDGVARAEFHDMVAYFRGEAFTADLL